MKIDPTTDLVLERVVDVAPELVYRAWTEPEHLVHWFTPAPWRTVECQLDLRRGGLFRTVMRSPEGEDFPNLGCVLDFEPNRRLVFTDSLEADFRPLPLGEHVPFRFTAHILIEPHGSGAKYTAIALHTTAEARQKHEDMGFHNGWGTALDQLVAYMKTVAR